MGAVNAKWWKAWTFTPAGLFGHLPKVKFSCGDCGTYNHRRPIGRDRVFAWCWACGQANFFTDGVNYLERA